MMLSSAAYWESLTFDSVTTYSFNRGPKLQHLVQELAAERQALRQQLLHHSGAQLQQIRQRLHYCETAARDLLHQPLTLGASWHSTAVPVAQLAAAEVGAIGALLRRPVLTRYDWMCGPVYRDALVFNDTSGQLQSVLNICFSCDQMLTDRGEDVAADITVFRELKELLRQLGHPIGDDER